MDALKKFVEEPLRRVGESHYRLRFVGVGRAHRNQRVLILMADLDVRVIDENGEMLRHLLLDPSVDYQRRDREIV